MVVVGPDYLPDAKITIARLSLNHLQVWKQEVTWKLPWTHQAGPVKQPCNAMYDHVCISTEITEHEPPQPSHWKMIWRHSYGLGFIWNHFEPVVSQELFFHERFCSWEIFRSFICECNSPVPCIILHQGIAGPALQGVQQMPIIHVETPPQNPVPDFIQCFDWNLTNLSFAFRLLWDSHT